MSAEEAKKYMDGNTSHTIYTLFVGVMFLVVVCGMLAVLLFVNMPASNEKPIMLICGGIMTAAAIALGNLARGGQATDALVARVRALETSNTLLTAKLETKDDTITQLLFMLQNKPDEIERARIEDKR